LCKITGVCNTQCIRTELADVVINSVSCRDHLSVDCEAKCKYYYFRDCNFVNGSGCVTTYADGFKDCIHRCAGIPVEPSPCDRTTRLCDCNFDSCYWCQQTFSSDGKVFTVGTCVPNTAADSCQAIRGDSLFSRPDLCAVLTTPDIPDSIKQLIEQIRKLTRELLQQKIDEIHARFPELKRFIIRILDSFDPTHEDLTIKVRVILNVTPEDGIEPTTDERNKICRDLIIPATKDITGAEDADACILNKVTPTTSKRGIQQAGGADYVANLNYAGTTADSSKILISMFVIMIVLISLLI
jgi:hypothetical protein